MGRERFLHGLKEKYGFVNCIEEFQNSDDYSRVCAHTKQELAAAGVKVIGLDASERWIVIEIPGTLSRAQLMEISLWIDTISYNGFKGNPDIAELVDGTLLMAAQI